MKLGCPGSAYMAIIGCELGLLDPWSHGHSRGQVEERLLCNSWNMNQHSSPEFAASLRHGSLVLDFDVDMVAVFLMPSISTSLMSILHSVSPQPAPLNGTKSNLLPQESQSPGCQKVGETGFRHFVDQPIFQATLMAYPPRPSPPHRSGKMLRS